MFENHFLNYKLYQLLLNQQVKRKLKHKVELNPLELKAKQLLNKVKKNSLIYILNFNEIFFLIARLKAQATKIEAEAELSRLKLAREAEIKFLREQNELEINKKSEMSTIETEKFKLQVEAIGPETIQAIATSGPDTQVKLLQALGLQSMLVTDGHTPINLMGFGQGLLGGLNGNTNRKPRVSRTTSNNYHVEEDD